MPQGIGKIHGIKNLCTGLHPLLDNICNSRQLGQGLKLQKILVERLAKTLLPLQAAKISQVITAITQVLLRLSAI